MNILLDTHVLLWWYENPKMLSKVAREEIEDSRNTVFLSSGVIWELTIKSAIGKLKMPKGFLDMAVSDFIELPFLFVMRSY
jgi:PIN domain nuclease of toxin-antitoxin system